jgi:hypothetical protein
MAEALDMGRALDARDALDMGGALDARDALDMAEAPFMYEDIIASLDM